MIKTNKFKLLSFLSTVAFFQQSFSMCLKRTIRPISNNIKLNIFKIRNFSSSKKTFDWKKIKDDFGRSYSEESKPRKLESLPAQRLFFFDIDDKDFEALLDEYKEAKSIHNPTREHCSEILQGISKEKMFNAQIILGSRWPLYYFLKNIAELTGAVIASGDNEFGNILINWALDSSEIKIAHEYVKDDKIKDLVSLVRDSLLREMHQYYYDYLKHTNRFKSKQEQEEWKANYKVSDIPKYKNFNVEPTDSLFE